ncbi:MAG: response regulator [Candidatus Paceibacterota bacterium]
MSILLIEDEEVLREVLEGRFKKEGYNLRVANNGKEGLEMMRSDKPDLVLLDAELPKMDGLDVLEEINKDSDLKKVPTIIISNSGQPVQLEKAQKLGAADWIIKTEFNPQEVVNKVEQQLNA